MIELNAYLEVTLSGSSNKEINSGINLPSLTWSLDYLAIAISISMPINLEELYLHARMHENTILITILYYL